MKWLATALIATLLTGCASALRWDSDAPEGHYRVRSGDTLYSIALRHDLDYRRLAHWNNIGSNYLIRPGQVLRLSPPPGAGGQTQVARAPPASSGPPTRSPPASNNSSRSRPSAPSESNLPAFDQRWQWPLRGEVTRRFAPPDSKGINIGAQQGTEVRAAASGRVVYSGSALKGYGELIIIKHDDTYLSAYGYNSRRHAQEGDTVKAGQVIAEVGMGPARRSLLHFEIRKAGRPVDPLRLLPRSE
ncbi:peptidoglycan DD-metalloendopeptidase family protein [Algiphilus sp.]|uniref:peptidoglycan DD-metalloendopeptidase family protein n=1 Tax=Algiphilus sp. TaxID=1872431 RepID=UPI003BAAD6DF